MTTALQTALRDPLHASGINSYDVDTIRADFPILSRTVHARPGRPGKPLVYLDTGASAQKPRQVIEAVSRFYETSYSNVHRGLHALSAEATDAFEAARGKVRGFLNAGSNGEIVFAKNATEAINLVARSFGGLTMGEGDEVILSAMEHHANIVPWQLLRAEKGIVLRVVPVADDGTFRLDEYAGLFGPRTRMVAVTHCSNVLGTVTPAKEIVRIAHDHGVPVLLDGSQAVVHMPVDVRDLDADFYVFTGHKLYGPSGIGVLYGKAALLEKMPPFLGGGDMIRSVSFEETIFAPPPVRFEAGTPPIAQAVGLGAAIDYVTGLGREAIAAHEHALLGYATARLSEIPGLTILGRAPGKAAIVSFTLDCAHPHDIATILDSGGVAIRAGHHCAQPLMERFDVPATARASFGLYNTPAEIDMLVAALQHVRELFA